MRRKDFLSLLAVGSWGCCNGKHSNSTPSPPKFDARLQKARHELALRVLRDKIKETNVCVSPVSLAFALHLVVNGARGTTLSTMSKTLGITGIDTKTLNQVAPHETVKSRAL